MKHDIRLIAMDLDGTLLNRDGQISQGNREALLMARQQGIITALCSGRCQENTSLVFLQNGLTGPIVGSNGAQMMDRPMGQTIFEHFMLPSAARSVRRVLDRAGAEYFLFAKDLIVTSSPTGRHHSELSIGELITRLSPVRYMHGPEAVDEALRRGVLKYYVCDNGHLPELRELLAPIPDITLTHSGPWNLEMMAAGVNKGTGVREMAAYYHLTPDQVMAFGDQDNDLDMLLSVGVGVAMGNAEPSVLAQAPYRTLTNQEDGVGVFIRRYLARRAGGD